MGFYEYGATTTVQVPVTGMNNGEDARTRSGVPAYHPCTNSIYCYMLTLLLYLLYLYLYIYIFIIIKKTPQLADPDFRRKSRGVLNIILCKLKLCDTIITLVRSFVVRGALYLYRRNVAVQEPVELNAYPNSTE